ncbi:hypothetical protein [Chitinophaga nivalis]|uniref:Uncharacterized protein n=1 Tax=Chitinophaga nivalis TaxID=2991709 RepID=A0ABT3IFE8_9BACT|nr:hypothetical protein [Chitinophaga nivalis]MCW3467642.1 hypothetical protein [Chitinophaga nivalis]MCW3482666.1 hypothetical protein [Chitinophaga nivalis]
MSRQQAQLLAGLQKINSTPATIIPAMVTRADEANGIIDVKTAQGLDIYDVRLSAVTDYEEGLLLVPPEKSSVLIARINDTDNYLLISTAAITKIKCRISDKQLELDKDGLALSAGGESLKKCLDDLLDEIVTIYAPMNKAAFVAIKQRLATLLK